MPNGTMKSGVYGYTKTISPDGKVISNNRYHRKIGFPKRDVFYYYKDGRLVADQVNYDENIATLNSRVNELPIDQRYI